MAEPGPKRLKTRLVTTIGEDSPFSYLPPDVIVSEILIHITVGEDIFTTENDIAGRAAKVVGCFGRFKRTKIRHVWAIFRNINVNPALLSLALMQGSEPEDQRRMILPLNYMRRFTVPSFSSRRDASGEFRTFYHLRQFLAKYEVNFDDLKLPSSVIMRNLTTISSLLIRSPTDRDTNYPLVTSIVMQSPMDEIPEWCETLHISSEEDGLFWWGSDPLYTPRHPWWVAGMDSLLDTLRSVAQHSRPSLKEIVLDLGDLRAQRRNESILVEWDMRNVPNLQRFVMNCGKWDPQFLSGVGSYYGFLTPLGNLDELVLYLTIPTRYDRHWFLPPVRKKLRVMGFSVPRGYVFPPNSEFIMCRFDPTHTYLLPFEGMEELVIDQWIKYDAPVAVYQQRQLGDLHGRITMTGNVHELRYTHRYNLVPHDPEGPPIPTTDRQYVVERIGLPYEFVFNGDIDSAHITSMKQHWPPVYQYPDTSLVNLNGWTKELELHYGMGLHITAKRVTNLHVPIGRNLTVTVTEPVLKVYMTAPEVVTLHIPDIDEFLCDNSKMADPIASVFTVNGSINRAFIKGLSLQNPIYCNFDRVINLTMENCTAIVRINDLDAVQLITFVNIIARNITFIWPDDTPTVRIPRNKLIFMKMESREVSKLRRKLSQFTED